MKLLVFFHTHFLLAVLLAAKGVDAANSSNSNAATDEHNPLRYIPSNTLTAIAITCILVIAISQTICTSKWGAKYMLPMVIGGYTFAVGFALRFILHNNPDSIGIYIGEDLFTLLSPCAFIAACYVLLGRLAYHLDCNDFMLIQPSRIAKVFIASDLATFLIQALGGSMSAGAKGNISRANLGVKISTFGLFLQLISFAIFTVIYVWFLYRVKNRRTGVWEMDSARSWFDDWRSLAYALIISCVGILVRCTFRAIEISQGYIGFLATHEPYFYLLDTLPLVIATAVLIPFWPGRIMTDRTCRRSRRGDTVELLKRLG